MIRQDLGHIGLDQGHEGHPRGLGRRSRERAGFPPAVVNDHHTRSLRAGQRRDIREGAPVKLVRKLRQDLFRGRVGNVPNLMMAHRGRPAPRYFFFRVEGPSTGARLPRGPLPLPELRLGPLPPPLLIDPGPLLLSRPPPPLPKLLLPAPTTVPTMLPTAPPPPELRLEPPPLPLPKVAIPPPRLTIAGSRDPATPLTSVAAPSLTSATGTRASVPEELSLATLASAEALTLAPPPRVSPLRATSAAVARARAPWR